MLLRAINMHTLSPVPRRFKLSTDAHRQRKIPVCAGIVTVWLCGFHLLGATNSSVSDYSFDVWQTEQGLPQDSVTSVVQTREGYLWLGTYNGLVRFDGVRFKIFDTSNTPEFGDSRITSLFKDADGALWIGHETGDLTQLRAGKFSVVNLGNNWPGGSIFAMGTDVDGVLWMLSREGALLSLQGAKLVAPNVGPVENVPSFAKDKNGELWVVRGSLLGSLRKGRLAPWVPRVQPDTSDVQRACASRDGGLWLMGSGRVKKLIGQETVVDRGPAPWGQDLVTALLETKSGVCSWEPCGRDSFCCRPTEPTCISRVKMGCRMIGCSTCAKIVKGTCGWEPAAAVWMSYGGGKWKW